MRPLHARVEWLLLAIYAAARVAQAFPDDFPILLIVALHVLPPLLFALTHGARVYGVRGISVFVLLCLVIGNAAEEIGLSMGVPFGRYHFTDVMGPALFHVPILLGLAYIGVGYLSWTLARSITGSRRAAPFLAALIMVSWDLSMDPVWSNLGHAWVWHDGGSYFGVPLTNFAGWYLTVWVIYQSFALTLRQWPTDGSRLPVLFYGVCAIGNLCVRAPAGLPAVADPTGKLWTVSSIRIASALVSIFLMGGFAVLAWTRTKDKMRINDRMSACIPKPRAAAANFSDLQLPPV